MPTLPTAPFLIARALVLVAAMLVVPCLSPAAAQSPPTMIIFDGSGSIWGRIEGDKKTAKLDLAREALRTALPKAPASARYGLMSYGHRRAGDCSDVEVLSPVAPADPSRVMGLLDKLNPRGKGPIAATLREAAKALAGSPQASIILLHDNADNCRQDPCEVATEIASAAPGLKINLVAIGLDEDELERMTCVPKITGGKLFAVAEASAMMSAVGDAVALAMLDPSAAAPGAEGKPADGKVAAEGPRGGAPGVRLSAKLGPGAPRLTLPVTWRILKGGVEPAVFTGTGSEVSTPLEPGSYTVEGRIGFVTARATAEVQGTGQTPGQTPVELILNAAALRVSVLDLKDGPPSPTAIVTLRAKPDGQPASERPLWIGAARDADFVMPAGSYQISITDSLFEREETVTLAAGSASGKDITTGAGRLELTAVAKPDSPPLDGAMFIIARDDPEAADGRREIARSAATRPTFVLPAGTYYVTARVGTAEVRQRVAIGAGDSVKRAVAVGLARIKIVANEPQPPVKGKETPPAGPKLPILARALALDGEPREVARSAAAEPEFTLAPGRYRIEASIGPFNVRAVQDIEVDGSAPKRIAMKLDAGAVVLQPPAGTAALDVSWAVKDAAGVVLLRTSQPSPRLVLAPGRYAVQMTNKDKRIERMVDVTAGSAARTIEFAFP